MKKKACDGNNSDKGGGDDLKQKERHLVSWSKEEDDILRKQIGIHGTNNWAIIASKFEKKTTRQCRRRWFTYLNSDFKKGGWTPEEDIILCEAQKIFGNRWTEIAKVVSGRTDNAVKNRFSILCKRKAKHEASSNENNAAEVNANNKRTMFDNREDTEGILETSMHPMKLRRKHIAAATEDCNLVGLVGDSRTVDQKRRPPFVVLVQNCDNTNTSTAQIHASSKKALIDASSGIRVEGTTFKKDDPKIVALMQQAELLNSLASEVNIEKTDQSFKSAWKAVQDFLNHTKESDKLRFHISDMEFQLENFKILVEDIRSCRDDNQRFWSQADVYQGSPDSSEYGTMSSIPSHINEKTKMAEDLCKVEPRPSRPIHPNNLVDDRNIEEYDAAAHQDIIPSSSKLNDDVRGVCPLSNSEFSSPLQVTPLFRSMAEGILSPQFSESEKHFLLKTLGMEPTTPNPTARTSQSPPCKRALLHCL
ncbi:transcription factor MYB124-like isoform X2 [Cynara cardunculus var. scolymus]|uniref:transcription factor MYB124-like isoform X2 n=1 Tax=Cynara cardunculus var. scolymus TaxID=59895 RepID=UPI000D62C3C8|nr:transcription factor MYB124-like isoform X2 [Cynara cardunculus var. scolymus]